MPLAFAGPAPKAPEKWSSFVTNRYLVTADTRPYSARIAHRTRRRDRHKILLLRKLFEKVSPLRFGSS